jgi:fructose-bisphosphate aldolase, class II
VYKPGNVKLHPELLGKHQSYVKKAIGAKEDKPVFLVFHGGSGSSKQEFLDAIGYGVVKVNVDTDMQFSYLSGIRDYILSKKDYLMKQVGNPDGEDKPNKKYYDPRVSLPVLVNLPVNRANYFPRFGFAKERRPCLRV